MNQRYSFASGISGQYLEDQGSKTVVSDNYDLFSKHACFLNQILHMDSGDFLELRTDYGFFTGEVSEPVKIETTFCALFFSRICTYFLFFPTS